MIELLELLSLQLQVSGVSGKRVFFLLLLKKEACAGKPLKAVSVVHLGGRVVPLHFKKVGKTESCALGIALGDMGGCTS